MKKWTVRLLIAIVAMAWLVIAFTPFFFAVVTSLKTQMELFTGNVFTLPKRIYWGNYLEILTTGTLFRYLRNSAVVVGISLVLTLAASAGAAYPLARFSFRGKQPMNLTVLAGMAIPLHATLIPVFLMSRDIGLYDTLWALIGPYVAFNIPMSAFILTGFMKTIPREMEEAAEIDGCGRFRTFFMVVLPLSAPGMATLAIYNSVMMWNEFIFALVLTQSTSVRTLPLSIWEYQGQYTSNQPMILAALTLSALPIVLAFAIGQDRLIRGMMAGAVKG
ncbi:MAG: carbohydrate ABC transporter permease [Clostridia bacterium]|nr:carbohydrate ABC transporter permease [Clostridia bacterium]